MDLIREYLLKLKSESESESERKRILDILPELIIELKSESNTKSEKERMKDVIKECFQEVGRERVREKRKLLQIKYSVNLIWINKILDVNAKYIYNGFDPEKNFFQPISLWIEKNPNAFINVWFDSKHTTRQALEESRKVLYKYTNVRLLDIRRLPLIKRYRAAFSHVVPIYFRVDCVRMIIALYLLNYYGKQSPSEQLAPEYRVNYFIYSDIDVAPVGEDEIFGEWTLNVLNNIGIVMLGDTKVEDMKERDYNQTLFKDPESEGVTSAQDQMPYEFENRFQWISDKQHYLLYAIDYLLVQCQIRKALHFMNGTLIKYSSGLEYKKLNLKDEHIMTRLYEVLSESVYHSYRLMYCYYLHLMSKGQLYVQNHEELYPPNFVNPQIDREYISWYFKGRNSRIPARDISTYERNRPGYAGFYSMWAKEYLAHLQRIGVVKTDEEDIDEEIEGGSDEEIEEEI